MTEEEARTKWCPMARTHGTYITTGSDSGFYAASNDGAKCIASACMMWRCEDIATQEPHGYCGLAGAASIRQW